MSSMELKQLNNCLEHFADILDQLGITEAHLSNGKFHFHHNGNPINRELMRNFCTHISSLCSDNLAEDREEDLDPDYFG